MRFLADESCDFAVVRQLRSAGHDVSAVAEFRKRSVDQEVMDLAYYEQRILLTEDKDFGWLAFVAYAKTPGVVLIRFPASARNSLPATMSRVVVEFEHQIKGAFVVLTPGAVRISPLPSSG